MDEKKLKEIKMKLNQLNDQNRFEEAIALIETIPEQDRDLDIQVCYAYMLNNIAMITLGEYDKDMEREDDNENSCRIPYIKEAILRLENLKKQGQDSCNWNKRMANAYYSMGHVLEDQSVHYYSLALPYFQKRLALECQSKKHEALKMVDECIENLANRYLAQKNYLKGFQLIEYLSTGWKNYSPYLLVTGIKEQDEKEIDEDLSEKLDMLAEQGNNLLDIGKETEALKAWQEALNLIPFPKNIHLETVWFEASMGEIYFTQRKFNQANILYNNALINQLETRLDSHILMRLGECNYELGNRKLAKRILLQAYELEGEEVFRNDEVNLKYLAFLLEEIKKDEEARKHPFKDFDSKNF